MSFLQKADLTRQKINVKATAKAGTAATNVLGSVVDLGLNAGLALVTRSPWAAAATVVSAGILVNELFS